MAEQAEQASRDDGNSRDGVEAFQVGLTNKKKGEAWSYKANGPITGIMIGYKDDFIGSLVFQSIDKKGNIEYSDTFGSYDKNVDKIILDPRQQEYFTSLSVEIRKSKRRNSDVITSIDLRTNKGHSHNFPIEHKKARESYSKKVGMFEFSLEGRVIVGFYGREVQPENDVNFIAEGLGVYVTPEKKLVSSFKQAECIKELVSSFKQAECIKVGPWGWSRSLEEKEWSYMLELKLKMEIKIYCNNDNHIQAISFKLPPNKKEVKYPKNSNTGTVEPKLIPLNFPEEYLVSISGTTNSSKSIESLCFYTNKTIHGPFGPMKGNRFRFYMKRGIIVGFHGRGANLFDALGVYIKPFSELFKNENT